MVRSILVPVDGSIFAEHALPLAMSIARRAGADEADTIGVSRETVVFRSFVAFSGNFGSGLANAFESCQATLLPWLSQENGGKSYTMNQTLLIAEGDAELGDCYARFLTQYARLQRAREEHKIAVRVAELELDRFQKGQGTLLEVNLRELAAAGAQSKVVDALADFFRAHADYRAALGLDTADARRPKQ